MSSAGWSAGTKLTTHVVRFASSIILARLIDPSAFGLVAMLALFMGAASTLTDLGLGSALVQRNSLTAVELDTAFWTSTAIGAFSVIVIASTATLVAEFFKEPLLAPLLLLSALAVLFSAIAVVPAAVLVRKLEIRRLEIINLIGMLIGVTTSLLMALWIPGPLPLILGPLVASGVSTTALLCAGGWWPKLRFHPRSLGPVARVGIYLAGFGIMNYASRNLDNLLIGKLFGPEPLAFYSRAYALMLLPITSVNSALANTLTSVFARLQHDKPRCGRLFITTLSTISLVSFPSMLGLCLVAEPFVLTVYGEKWMPMVPILRILALSGMLQGASNATGWIFISQGRTDWLFRFSFISAIAFVISFSIGAAFGSALAVAAAYTVTEFVLTWPALFLSGRLIGLSLGKIIASMKEAALCSSIMGAAVWLVVDALSPRVAPHTQLFAGVLTGVILYTGLSLLLQRQAINNLRRALRKHRA